jgi:MFS family permease
VSGRLSDRIGPRIPATIGVIPLVGAYALGVLLRMDSHWLLPATVLALTGVGAALFNAPNHAAVIGSVPRQDRGFATGFIYTVFGLGHMLGVSVGALLLTLGFQHYSGIPGATPHPDNGFAFVSAMNACYLAALLLSLAALGASLMRGDATLRPKV